MITKKQLAPLKELLTESKKILCIGSQNVYRDFIQPFCLEQELLPLPYAIFDSLEKGVPSAIYGIPVLDLSEIMKEDPYSSLIVIAEEDEPFYIALGKLYDELIAYYFPILPCTAIEAYFFAQCHMNEINEVINLFKEAKSRELYENYWLSRIFGIVYNPMLYSKSPYFGNELIPNLTSDDIIVSGGTYNGKHIDRALTMNCNISAYLFEPNQKYYHLLKKHFEQNNRIKVFNNALYDSSSIAAFDSSDELGAKIVSSTLMHNCNVDTLSFDSLNLGKVTLIELDIEGSEVKALYGMRQTIKKYNPKLAICVYHKLTDYLEIPKLILEINPNYSLFFRQHSCYYEESVLYALLPESLIE